MPSAAKTTRARRPRSSPVPTDEPTDELTLHNVFHMLWTRDVGTPGYQKPIWRELDRLLCRLRRPSPGFPAPPVEYVRGFAGALRIRDEYLDRDMDLWSVFDDRLPLSRAEGSR